MKKYEEYRKEIKEILDRNKRQIPITSLLKELGITRGNYYAFMCNSRGDNSATLSYTKLDTLLEELKRLDAGLKKENNDASNINKLNAMSVNEYAAFIEETFINNPNRSQIDIKTWLKSHKPDLIYKEKKQ